MLTFNINIILCKQKHYSLWRTRVNHWFFSGKKLSKREHAASIRGERDAGITPEKLLGEICHEAALQPDSKSLSVREAIQIAKKFLFPAI